MKERELCGRVGGCSHGVWHEPEGGILARGWYWADDANGRHGPFVSHDVAVNHRKETTK